MKKTFLYVIVTVAFLTLLIVSARAIDPPSITLVPSEVSPGGVVTISVQMHGNVALPSKTFDFTLSAEYYDGEDATTPTVFPVLTYKQTMLGAPGALVKNPKWTLTLPPSWTYVSEPASTGYMGASTLKQNGGIQFNATALLSDVTGNTTWTMLAR